MAQFHPVCNAAQLRRGKGGGVEREREEERVKKRESLHKANRLLETERKRERERERERDVSRNVSKLIVSYMLSLVMTVRTDVRQTFIGKRVTAQ